MPLKLFFIQKADGIFGLVFFWLPVLVAFCSNCLTIQLGFRQLHANHKSTPSLLAFKQSNNISTHWAKDTSKWAVWCDRAQSFGIVWKFAKWFFLSNTACCDFVMFDKLEKRLRIKEQHCNIHDNWKELIEGTLTLSLSVYCTPTLSFWWWNWWYWMFQTPASAWNWQCRLYASLAV